MSMSVTKFTSIAQVQKEFDELVVCSQDCLQQIIEEDEFAPPEITDKTITYLKLLVKQWHPSVEWNISISLDVDENGQSKCFFSWHSSETYSKILEAAYKYKDYLYSLFTKNLLRSSNEAVIQNLHELHSLAISNGETNWAKKLSWIISNNYNVDLIEYSEENKEYFEEALSNSVDVITTTRMAIINRVTKEQICSGVVCKPINNK